MSDTNGLNKEEILRDHGPLIHRVVMDCNEPGSAPDLTQILQMAEDNDWVQLVATIRNILSGNRDRSMLNELDEEETIIIESILDGLEDPVSLPSLPADFQSEQAAAGIAGLIQASMQGSAQSLGIVANMARQMLEAGGDYEIIAGQIRPLIDGERDLGKLTANMSAQGVKFMTEILAELSMLEAGQ